MSKNLITSPNFEDGDGFYAALLDLHDGKPEIESSAINIKLVLLLANHIGTKAILDEALEAAERKT